MFFRTCFCRGDVLFPLISGFDQRILNGNGSWYLQGLLSSGAGLLHTSGCLSNRFFVVVLARGVACSGTKVGPVPVIVTADTDTAAGVRAAGLWG